MSKPLPAIGMAFRNKNDNNNECLNTKTEKDFQTCKHPVAFIIKITVCCSEMIKILIQKNVIQLKRMCAEKVIHVTCLLLYESSLLRQKQNIVCHFNCSI